MSTKIIPLSSVNWSDYGTVAMETVAVANNCCFALARRLRATLYNSEERHEHTVMCTGHTGGWKTDSPRDGSQGVHVDATGSG